MARYVIRIFVSSLLAVLLAAALVFFLGRLTGDPVGLILGDSPTVEQIEALTADLGLDQPLYIQFGIFLKNAVRGDFGMSLRSRLPVTTLIAERVGISATLAGLSIALAGGLGIPMGVVAGRNRGGRLDTFVRSFALLGQSAPAFVTGIICIQIFAVWLGLLPSAGVGTPQHYVLPTITLALFPMAGIVRLTRSGMIDALDSEYVKLARIKGLPERTVVWRHALRNALIPVVTFGGLYFSIVITLAVVQEVVFSWPGLGRLAYDGIVFRDFPVLQAVVALGVAFIIAVNLVIDLLYGVIDPRVRRSGNGASG